MTRPSREERERRLAEAKARFQATMRELLSPEDLRDIVAAARQAHREDFPEDFPTGGRVGFREHLLAPTDDGFICRRCGRFSRDEHSDETCLGEEEGGGS